MKVRFHSSPSQSGFTLNEVVIASSFLLLVMLGVVSVHMFGLRIFELTRAKLGAGDDARKAINLLSTEIRSGKIVDVGIYDGTTFTECALYTPQQGSAVRIQPTTDTNRFICYYLDSDAKLKRFTEGTNSPTVVASSITNTLVFTCEDYAGTVLTNNFNNRVIGVTLQFYQIQYPIIKVGPGNYYDFYQLQTRITRRALE